MNEKNGLTVLEAYPRDVGRGVARIESKTMAELGLSKGDIIEIKGRRTTAVKCLSGLAPEQLEAERIQLTLARQKLHKTTLTEKNEQETKFEWNRQGSPTPEMKPTTLDKTIRIDGLTRNNAGIAIGDAVTIRKVVASQAEIVSVVPLEAIPPIDERYLTDALEGIPVMKGDNIMVPYFGGRLTFNVIDVAPNAVSIVTQKTVFSITTKGPTLMAVGDFKYYADGKNIVFLLEDAVRRESSKNDYLVLKIRLHHDRFVSLGEYQIKLEEHVSLENLVSRYKELAQEIVVSANKNLDQSRNINSAELINGIKFEILEKWRTVL